MLGSDVEFCTFHQVFDGKKQCTLVLICFRKIWSWSCNDFFCFAIVSLVKVSDSLHVSDSIRNANIRSALLTTLLVGPLLLVETYFIHFSTNIIKCTDLVCRSMCTRGLEWVSSDILHPILSAGRLLTLRHFQSQCSAPQLESH